MADPTQTALNERLAALGSAIEVCDVTGRERAIPPLTAALLPIIEGYGDQAAELMAPVIYDAVDNVAINHGGTRPEDTEEWFDLS